MTTTTPAAPATEARAPRGERNEGRRGPRPEREPRPVTVADEAPLAAQAFVDTMPIVPADAGAEGGERDAGRRRRRRGGRGRGRDEGNGADVVSPMVDEPQGGEQAVDSAPIAVESVLAEQAPRAAAFAPDGSHRDEESEMAFARVATPAPAPTPAPVAATAPPALPVRPVAAPAPVAAAYSLPTDTLAAMASNAGLQWVNSDAEKIRAVQEAMANEPKPARAPRPPKPRVVIDDGPLVLIETKKDLAQVRLPFDSNTPPAAP